MSARSKIGMISPMKRVRDNDADEARSSGGAPRAIVGMLSPRGVCN